MSWVSFLFCVFDDLCVFRESKSSALETVRLLGFLVESQKHFNVITLLTNSSLVLYYSFTAQLEYTLTKLYMDSGWLACFLSCKLGSLGSLYTARCVTIQIQTPERQIDGGATIPLPIPRTVQTIDRYYFTTLS